MKELSIPMLNPELLPYAASYRAAMHPHKDPPTLTQTANNEEQCARDFPSFIPRSV